MGQGHREQPSVPPLVAERAKAPFQGSPPGRFTGPGTAEENPGEKKQDRGGEKEGLIYE